jgi:hypothetical protein
MARIEYMDHLLPSGRSIRVKFVYDSLFAKVVIPHMTAITLWNRVYCNRPTLSRAVILHELRHVEQWYALGPLRFLAEYLWESVRYGYHHNRFERDAREAERETTASLE